MTGLTVQNVLGSQNSNGALASDQFPHLQSLLLDPLQPALDDPADETHRLRFGRAESTSGKAEFSSERIGADYLGETLKRADICC